MSDEHAWTGDGPLEVQSVKPQQLHHNVLEDSNSIKIKLAKTT